MNKLNIPIIYMGTPDFAVAPLKALIDGGYNVVATVTVPDKPAGRGQKLQKSAVKIYAESIGLPVLQPVKLRDEDFLNTLKSYNAKLFIVVAFRMLPEVVWQMPELGTFNLHASLLPQYRGAAPINWAIINGDTKTGVTTFFINKDIDTGDIIQQREVEIAPTDTAETLHDKLMAVGAELVVSTVDIIGNDEKTCCQKQNIANATTIQAAPKIFRETCKINWAQSAEKIYNFIRGLSPYPAAWCNLSIDGAPTSAKIYFANCEIKQHNLLIGTIETNGKSYLKVACNNGFLSITQIQIAGKKAMPIASFLAGIHGKIEMVD